MSMTGLQARATAYAALGDASRLAIIELLAPGDLASGELGRRLGIASNLLAHHLHVLEDAGLIARHKSEGDGRRTYISRTRPCNDMVNGRGFPRPHKVAFICSQNSARSQLAESFWRTVSDVPVVSGGTDPAPRVHPRAVAVGRRHGLDLTKARPRLAAEVLTGGELVIAVCDRAFEELDTEPLHWSIPDPASGRGGNAFDTAYLDIADRITRLAASFAGPED